MPNEENPRRFPCPVCLTACGVRMTIKRKPYIICDPCGVQLFVRGPAGITAFNQSIERPGNADVWAAMKIMQGRYRLQCPKCTVKFWIEPELVETSMFDGSLKGFRCPQKNCEATIPWRKKS